MAPSKTHTKKTESPLNPLEAYVVAIETLMGAAKGNHRSRLRIEAAQTLLEHTAIPPQMNWDFEDDDE